MTGLDIVTFVFIFLGMAGMWTGVLVQMFKIGPDVKEDARLLIGIGFGIVLTACLMFTTAAVLNQFMGYDLNACISYQVLVHPPIH